jgi:hypothetical protein
MFLWLISMSALAGYGEIVIADDGEAYPSWLERDVHMWTNMMRVDPVAFFGPESQWYTSCGIEDFLADEKTPKLPLYYDFDLNDAGRFHSKDMYENDWFEHSSSDGTSFGERVSRFYDESGYLGENIALGYPDGEAALVQGWMCSAGHRANIMTADFNELGVGVEGLYFTQDFAAGTLATDDPIAMGLHSPEYPLESTIFLADFQGFEPDTFDVVVDGRDHALDLTFGTPSQGVFSTEMTFIGEVDCHQYYFLWSLGTQTGTFPESGSYLLGTQCDSDTMWVNSQLPVGYGQDLPEERTEEDIQDEAQDQLDAADVDVVGCSCSTTSRPSVGGLWGRVGMWLLAGGLAVMRRKDHRPSARSTGYTVHVNR